MNASGLARMRVVGKALAGLDPKTHNAMVAALSKRAAPYERWGPNLSPYPDVVRARIDALQTGDLVLCSSGAGKWVGNAIQVLTDSTWNHVAMVVRGHMTFDEETDQAPHGDDIARHSDVKRFAKHRDRTPYHFHVEVAPCVKISLHAIEQTQLRDNITSISTQVDEGTCGTPHLLEASGEGVHIYPNIQDRLLSSQAYEEYTTVAVRALTGLDEWKTPEHATRLEEWIAKIRGTEFEAEAPLHALFTADAGDLDSMHCAEMTTATLQHMGLLSRRLVSEWTLNFDVTRSPRRRRRDHGEFPYGFALVAAISFHTGSSPALPPLARTRTRRTAAFA
jgi:hypothetical protein